VHRGHHAPADEHHPLLASSPHDVVPFLHSIYEHHLSTSPGPLLEEMPSPRILAVHAPFTALPASVRESACRVVYLCRDPKDAFVSLRHYLDEIKLEGSGSMTPFAEAFDLFCDGVSPFGPVWDSMAEYWKESVARPEEVMFLQYEDLKEDTVGSVRRLAAFLGCPFTDEEVERGVPTEIVALCSMDKMRSVQANREGMHRNSHSWFKNSAFFRKGEVGDWRAHMTPEMARRLDGIMEEKLRGSGLSMINKP
jgi:estrone sulfotransferase